MQGLTKINRIGRSRKVAGFTLIELMITLVIVGILAAIGYPAYVDYSTRARRSDGKTLLMDAAARMERYYYDNNQYTTTLTDLGYAAGTVTSADGSYVLNNPAVGATGSINTSYSLTAQINPAQSFDDDCGNLTLDNRGTEGVTGSESVTDCWGR